MDHDYHLIGIHCVLNDYRLAYLLNQTLHIQLKKEKNLNTKKEHADFSLFTFEDGNSFQFYALIKNKEYKAIKSDSSLFSEITNTYILINEKKEVDYFFKIESDYNLDQLKSIVKKINSIYRVQTCYIIDPKKLRHKEFLIF